ncbi:uncharacterized protein LOC131882949 [Tigriopus californicus]|uniref:uncharacterized protein LOC131882949 n=1 Tax=Tigriopus californicus TaxID=6832 RepID=UPI0027DA825A|nr:uncharacterized protein LOC131882949 [Tigriopus californicus]
MKSIRANPQIQDIIQKFNQKYNNYGSSQPNNNNNGAVASVISKRIQRLNNHNGRSKKAQTSSLTSISVPSSLNPTGLLHYSATTLDHEDSDPPPERGPLPSEVKQNNLLLIQKPGEREKNKSCVPRGFKEDTKTKNNKHPNSSGGGAGGISGSGWRTRCFKKKLTTRKDLTRKVPTARESLSEHELPTSCSCSEADEIDRGVILNPKCWCEMETSTYEPIGSPSTGSEKDPSTSKLNPIVKPGHQGARTQMDGSTSFVSATQTDLEDGQELYDKKVDVRNTQIVMGVNVNPNFEGGDYLDSQSKRNEGLDPERRAKPLFGQAGQSQKNPKQRTKRTKSTKTRASNMVESDNDSEEKDRDVESGSIRETMNQDAGQAKSEPDPNRRPRPNLKRDDSFAGLNFDIVTVGSKSRKTQKKEKKGRGKGWSKSKILLLLWTIVGLVLWVIVYMILRLFLII